MDNGQIANVKDTVYSITLMDLSMRESGKTIINMELLCLQMKMEKLNHIFSKMINKLNHN